MSILTRYIALQYLKGFAWTALAVTGLFLTIDFFERIGRISQYQPPITTVFSYFLWKLPAIASQMYPAASLLAVLLSLGALARNREILALHACGISTWQLAYPLVAVAGLGSIAAIAFNETIVPPAAVRTRYVYDVLIKNKPSRGGYNAASIWFQGRQGFVNIEYFDAAQATVFGLSMYDADPAFRLHRMVHVPVLRWRDGRWEPAEGSVKDLGPDGGIVTRPLAPGELARAEKPDELASQRRQPQEFSYRQLKAQIDVLRAKGLSADEQLVDLHTKIAWPLAGLVTVALGFPLAVRSRRRVGLGRNLVVGLIVGFAYWVVTALALSAGRTGAVPPLVAAWAANLLFSVLAALLFLGTDAA